MWRLADAPHAWYMVFWAVLFVLYCCFWLWMDQ